MMEIKTGYFKTEKSARYSCFGHLTASTKYVWMALHGSHMRCEQMLYKFSDFNPNEHFIIAPEGLSRFYQEGFGGEVVATWMTSRDRLKEIEDFSQYLSNLWKSVLHQAPATARKVILGFSQGGTSMFRWLHENEVEVDGIMGYSCWIPEDIDLRESKTPLNDLTAIYTYGRQDQYINSERLGVLNRIIKKNELIFPIEAYNGDHRIDKKQLEYLFRKYFYRE